MGIYDREYYRSTRGGFDSSRLTVTHVLLMSNAAVFVAMFWIDALFNTRIGYAVLDLFAMQADAVTHWQIWRLLTATYLHASWSHILFNMLFLYFLGRSVEESLGSRRFFVLYTVSGVAGYALLLIASWVGLFNPLSIALGASGCVLGVLGALMVLAPDTQINLYFVLPVKVKYIVALYVGMYLFNVLSQGQNYGGDICHLAGLAVGYGMTRYHQ